MKALLVCALAAATIGCTDFRSPADLKHPQVLGVRLEPPQLRPGERARLDGLLTDAEGIVTVAPPVAVALSADPGGRSAPPEAAMFIERADNDFWMRAPDEATVAAVLAALGLPADAPLRLPVRATFVVGGEERRADKIVTVLPTMGPTAPTPNPVVADLLVAGFAVGSGAAVIDVGVTSPLEALTLPDHPAPLSYAWYAGLGDLEGFRQPAARITAIAPGEGTLLVVVRDDRGGIAWKQAPLVAR